MARTGQIVLTLIRADVGHRRTVTTFFTSKRPTFADLIKTESMMAFRREDGSYYEDMEALVDHDQVHVRAWTQEMIDEHPDIVAQQYKIVRDHMHAMAARSSLSSSQRGEIECAINYMEDQVAPLVARAMHRRGTRSGDLDT